MIEIVNMLCKDYNLPMCAILIYVAVSNTLQINNAKHEKKSNKEEFGRVYKDIGRNERRVDNCEAAVKKVAEGQVETDKTVVEVLHEVKEVRIKLEEKYGRNTYGSKEKKTETA